jgi:hypothetical protein
MIKGCAHLLVPREINGRAHLATDPPGELLLSLGDEGDQTIKYLKTFFW